MVKVYFHMQWKVYYKQITIWKRTKQSIKVWIQMVQKLRNMEINFLTSKFIQNKFWLKLLLKSQVNKKFKRRIQNIMQRI